MKYEPNNNHVSVGWGASFNAVACLICSLDCRSNGGIGWLVKNPKLFPIVGGGGC